MNNGERFGYIAEISTTLIKGTKAVSVDEAVLTPSGLVGNREYVIVQAKPNEKGVHRWISQRDKTDGGKAQSLGIISQIHPRSTENGIVVTWQGKDEILVPNDWDPEQFLTIQIWNDILTNTADQGNKIAEWLSDHLKHLVKLVRVNPEITRKVSTKWEPNTNTLAGQDSYPLNWITKESHEELKRRILERGNKPVAITRWRSDVVVAGTSEPNLEHTFYTGTFGASEVINAKPCDRCPVPLIDQETGERDSSGEPLKTAATYKRWRKPDGSVFVIFGEGALPQNTAAIKVGDEVRMTAMRDPKIIFGGTEIKSTKNI